MTPKYRKILEAIAEDHTKVTIKHTFGRGYHGGTTTMRGTLDSYGINFFRVFANDGGEPGPGCIEFNVEMVTSVFTGLGKSGDEVTVINLWSPSPR